MRLNKLCWLILLMLAVVLAGCGNDDDDDGDDDTVDADDDTTDDDTAVDDDVDPGDSPLQIARALADTWIESYRPETMGWSWDSGLLMLGMWELYEQTDKLRYRNYVAKWIEHHLEVGYTIAYNDHVPPARLALRLWEETGDARYRQVLDDAREYIFEKAQRLPDGGLNHMGWLSGNQIWTDTLFMVTPFLVELGKLDLDVECFNETVLQFQVFANHLQDEDTGLYRHMYDADTDTVTPTEPDYWGRGNAWIIAASGIALRHLETYFTGMDLVRERFLRQAEAMAELIDDTNRWHTVMNRPQTYLETSVSPLFAFGVYQADMGDMADYNLLPVADRALRGALDQAVVDVQGGRLLLGTSYGTNPGTWEMYDYVLKGEQVTYGVGALLAAVCAREEARRSIDLPPAQETPETYIHPPVGEDPAEWGYFYMARGDFYSALDSFEEEVDGDVASAQFGAAVIEAARFVFSVLTAIDELSLGEMGVLEFVEQVLTDGDLAGQALSARMQAVEADGDFARFVERLVITEQGGSAGLGQVEVDLGEAYLLDAVGRLICGVADIWQSLGPDQAMAILLSGQPEALLNAEPKDMNQLVEGLDNIIAAIDLLIVGIEGIDAETDDQSDDLLPANLFHLEGEFKLPGIMLPTPVEELLAELGINVDELFGGEPMPQALLDWLAKIRNILQFISRLLS